MQQIIVHTYAKFKDSSFRFHVKTDTNFSISMCEIEKERKMGKNLKNKSKQSDLFLQYNESMFTCIRSLTTLAFIVPEKKSKGLIALKCQILSK